MSRNNRSLLSFLGPTLAWSVGLFAFALPASADGDCDARNEQSSFFRFPEIRFFWQQDRFQPNYTRREVLEVPEFPTDGKERIHFDEIEDPALSADPHRPDASRFELDFLRPLDAFLVERESPLDAIEETSRPLSLHQALFHAFASNPSVQVRDLQLAVEDERVTQEEAVFHPVFELSSEYAQSRFPQNAAEASAQNLPPIGDHPRLFLSKTSSVEAAVRGEIPSGTQYEVYSSLRYNESTLTRTSATALFHKEYSSQVGFRVTQPILQGSSRDVRETPIRIARINRKIAEDTLRTELNELAGRTLEAYFAWMEATEILQLRLWENRTYSELAEIIRRRVETGAASSREQLRVEIRLTRIDDQILQARDQVDVSRHQLFAEFGREFEAAEYDDAKPVGEMSTGIPEISAEAILTEAIQNSAEISSFRREIGVARENLGLALDETRPRLNLVGGVELQGLRGGPASSFDHLVGNQPLGYNIGVVYSRPWGNHSAEAKVRESRHALRQNEIQLLRAKRELRQRIVREVDRLAILRERRDNIARLQEGIAAEIEEENRRLETGQTTLPTLLEFYEELFQVRAQYLTIVRQINEAKVRLWTADHSILARLGVDYVDSTRFR